jgi:hypothetical protein
MRRRSIAAARPCSARSPAPDPGASFCRRRGAGRRSATWPGPARERHRAPILGTVLRRLTPLLFAMLGAVAYATAAGGSVASRDSRGDAAPGDTGRGSLRRGGGEHVALPVPRSEPRVDRPIEGRSGTRVPGGRGTTPVGLLSLGRTPAPPASETGSPWWPGATGTTQPRRGDRSARGPPPHCGQRH